MSASGIKQVKEPGSQAAYFRNHVGRHLCEVVETARSGSRFVWVRYPDEDTRTCFWMVPVDDLTPIGPVACELLAVRR